MAMLRSRALYCRNKQCSPLHACLGTGHVISSSTHRTCWRACCASATPASARSPSAASSTCWSWPTASMSQRSRPPARRRARGATTPTCKLLHRLIVWQVVGGDNASPRRLCVTLPLRQAIEDSIALHTVVDYLSAAQQTHLTGLEARCMDFLLANFDLVGPQPSPAGLVCMRSPGREGGRCSLHFARPARSHLWQAWHASNR